MTPTADVRPRLNPRPGPRSRSRYLNCHGTTSSRYLQVTAYAVMGTRHGANDTMLQHGPISPLINIDIASTCDGLSRDTRYIASHGFPPQRRLTWLSMFSARPRRAETTPLRSPRGLMPAFRASKKSSATATSRGIPVGVGRPKQAEPRPRSRAFPLVLYMRLSERHKAAADRHMVPLLPFALLAKLSRS
jgi:hypothetical protein